MSRISAFRLSLAGAVGLFMALAAITITPPSHDFGDINVNGMSPPKTFRVTVSGPLLGNKHTVKVVGQDASEFPLNSGDTLLLSDPQSCTRTSQGATCKVVIDFRPRGVGARFARLEVSDRLGTRARADLKGKGVGGTVCLYRVVECNYAHIWSGVFTWTSTTNAPGSQDTETVDVTVVNGVASCNGGATSSGNGKTRSARIQGPGLFAVEFLSDTDKPHQAQLGVGYWVYRITAACPSPHWPASSDEPETESRPAEMGHGEQSSDKQPAAATAMTLDSLISRLPKLEGRISFPGNDPVNGVTGTTTITWNLKRS